MTTAIEMDTHEKFHELIEGLDEFTPEIKEELKAEVRALQQAYVSLDGNAFVYFALLQDLKAFFETNPVETITKSTFKEWKAIGEEIVSRIDDPPSLKTLRTFYRLKRRFTPSTLRELLGELVSRSHT